MADDRQAQAVTGTDGLVGTCALCGQKLILTKDDCWHPWDAWQTCPPEPFGLAEMIRWLHAGNRSGRPGREHWRPA